MEKDNLEKSSFSLKIVTPIQMILIDFVCVFSSTGNCWNSHTKTWKSISAFHSLKDVSLWGKIHKLTLECLLKLNKPKECSLLKKKGTLKSQTGSDDNNLVLD